MGFNDTQGTPSLGQERRSRMPREWEMKVNHLTSVQLYLLISLFVLHTTEAVQYILAKLAY